MTTTITTNGITVLRAGDGMALTDGSTYSGEVWLARDAESSAWREVPAPTYDEEGNPIMKEYSKLKVLVALKVLGVWPSVKAWLEESDNYDYWLAAQDLAEDNEFFIAAKTAIAALTGKTAEEIAVLLAECEVTQ